MAKQFEKGKMVPVPSRAIVPERDVDKSPILECSHLGIDFGGLKAVNDFNLTIGRTEIAGLIGPNGAGKTTIFNLLTKVYQPTRGTILLDGLDTAGKTTAQINRMGIARTFQNIRLFNNLERYNVLFFYPFHHRIHPLHHACATRMRVFGALSRKLKVETAEEMFLSQLVGKPVVEHFPLVVTGP